MNETIQTLLQHRSIRKFKPQPLDKATIDLLVEVAQRASTSSYMQACTIISVTDETIKHELAVLGMQEYVRDNGHLFIFVADTARNSAIAETQGLDPVYQSSADRFLAGVYDCAIAAQNMVAAAESMGLGAVYLGTILNDAAKVIELLGLPPRTFPVFGLALGYPEFQPRLKPRLPSAIVHMENRYVPVTETAQQQALAEYDAEMAEYYSKRGSGSREETFSRMAGKYTHTQQAKRTQLGKLIRQQGFFTELDNQD
ncbi:NADPH-dependent oxidoreductase [Neisseria animalis]|uniref:NADPH-dependent oxidoreductase n=1 Tax=Neisseria animalis TaxID=492 RepID=A0A5P3MQ77_NEIAN|nr:NADPH-dependent oxidoreductase [Neisseria animalis]QEY23580.1 NADPH-dependent oxidoreductase [Neisseria animalis]ROW32900.1 NADPH-dependent oxidoreductase [Neisseria animalis]VEE09263.1 FMN reductase (NADPH) [Neisseria animalis]